jgi:hypothetical protein
MSGDSIDYAYGSAKIRWSYSVELRDTGTVSSQSAGRGRLEWVLIVGAILAVRFPAPSQSDQGDC